MLVSIHCNSDLLYIQTASTIPPQSKPQHKLNAGVKATDKTNDPHLFSVSTISNCVKSSKINNCV